MTQLLQSLFQSRAGLALAGILFVCAFAVCACAQDPSSQNTAVVSGTVVDSVTGQPLKSIEVRARSFSPGHGSPQSSSATTDAEGHFTLEVMAPGRYFFSAMRQGYVGQHISGGGSNGRALTVSPDQHTNDLVIELIPGATLSGHIKSFDGKALSGVSLEVVKYFRNGDEKQIHAVGSPAFTNSNGDYRVSGLAPGKYYVRAIAPSSSAKGASKEALPTTYYPNSTNISSASILSVRPGQDLSGMDLTITPVRAVTVSGKITQLASANPPSGAAVTLISDDSSSQVEVATDAKGNFELQAIPSRDYILVARVEPPDSKTSMLWGQRTLHVGEVNVRNANFAVGSGVPVSGRIHVDDKSNVDLTKITVDLQPDGNPSADALMPEVMSAQVRADGAFAFPSVPQGMHQVELSSLPQGYYVKSTAADPVENGLIVSQGASPPPLDIILSQNSAAISGSVSNDEMPAAGALVALLPEGSHSSHSALYKRSVADQSGRFLIKGIVPGDYKIVALLGVERGSAMDPEFLQQFEDRAESIHLQEGSTVNLTLDATPADEANQ